MQISDETMRENLAKTKEYTVVILHGTEKMKDGSARPIVWEHARRNFELRADGVLQIVCPVADGSGVSGVGIFAASPEETTTIMNGDPGVKAGLFTYEVHPCRSFPGDALK
jgi:hypothetical protein